MEEFKKIKGYENYYEISNYGNVKTLYNRYKKCIYKKPYLRKDGYVVINLVKDKKQTTFYLHRLVAEYFIENNDLNKNEVNHIDGNKQNNRFYNLEWCTSNENKEHAFKTGLSKVGSKRSYSKITEDMVFEIPNLLKSKMTIKQISKLYGVSTTAIHHILSGRNFRFLNVDFGYTFKKYNNKTTPR